MSIMIENADFDRIVSLANRFGWTPGGIDGTFADAVRMIEEALGVRIDELDRMTAEAQPPHADSANAAPDVSGDSEEAWHLVSTEFSADELDAKARVRMTGVANALQTYKIPDNQIAQMLRDVFDVSNGAQEIERLTAANRALESKVAACLAVPIAEFDPNASTPMDSAHRVGYNSARNEFRKRLTADAAQAESAESEGA